MMEACSHSIAATAGRVLKLKQSGRVEPSMVQCGDYTLLVLVSWFHQENLPFLSCYALLSRQNTSARGNVQEALYICGRVDIQYQRCYRAACR